MSENSVGQKRQAAPTLTQASTSQEVGIWLGSVLTPEELQELWVDDIDGAALLASTNISLLMDTKRPVIYAKITAALQTLQDEEPSTSRVRLSGDENAGAKRMDEGTDECAAEGVGSAMLRRIKRQKDDTPAPPALGSHPVFQISDDDDVENDENAVQLMDEAPLPAIVKPPPPGDAGNAADGTDDEDSDEDGVDKEAGHDDEDGDEAADAAADAAAEAAEADAVAAVVSHAPYVQLKACKPIQLPDDEDAQTMYERRALAGMQTFFEFSGTHVLSRCIKHKPLDIPLDRISYKQRASRPVTQLFNAILKPPSRSGKHAQTLLQRMSRLKRIVHYAFSDESFQKSSFVQKLLSRVMGLELNQHEVVRPVGDDGETASTMETHVVLRPDVAEVFWDLWQQAPLLGTMTLPVHSTASKVGHCWGDWFAQRIFKSINPRGDIASSENARVRGLLQSIKGIGARGNQNASSILVTGTIKRDESFVWEEQGASKMFVLSLTFFLEAGMVGKEIKEARPTAYCLWDLGTSAFTQYEWKDEKDALDAAAADLIYLLMELDHIKADPVFNARIRTKCKAHEDLSTRMAKKDVDPALKLDGLMFNRIMGLVADTQQEWPADLQEKLHPHMKFDLHKHQLAALDFVLKEEAADGGVQRNIWWELPLPASNAPAIKPYFSPHFNAIWWASSTEHLVCWDESKRLEKKLALAKKNKAKKKKKNNAAEGEEEEEEVEEVEVWPQYSEPAVRQSLGFKFVAESPPRGGLLALDMGLGKTAIMIAAHALEYDAQSEAVVMTQHSAAALEEWKLVEVGKDEDHMRESLMYTGFHQRNDLTRSIAPDGSVRIKGRGNLVVAPTTLVPQWESEIHKMCVQPQKVLVMHTMKDRKPALTTLAGLKALAEYDWIITTPNVAKKDIEMLRCIDWHRVIADEAHQLSATMAAGKGLNQRAAAYMRLLNSIPARGYWCLTGTPLRNMKQSESLDRIFSFIGAGFHTRDLFNLSLATVLSDIAIRYTKAGKLQGEEVLKLPPVTEEERMVNQLESDEMVEAMAKIKMRFEAGIPAELLAELQEAVRKAREEALEEDVEDDAAADAAVAMEEDEEEVDSDSDYDGDGRPARAKRAPRAPVVKGPKKQKCATAFKLCTRLIDPVRKALSGAMSFYFPNAGELTAETIVIGEPAELRRPRKKAGEEPMPLEEWRELRQERLAKYQETFLSSKIDAIVPDVLKIIADKGTDAKIVIYSNFDASFLHIKSRLAAEGVAYRTVDGKMSLKARASAMGDFQDDDETPVFLLNKGCGAMGINLTVASNVLIMEPSWNPVWEQQAISRVHRLGQKGPITVTRYITKGSVEFRLRELMKAVHEAADDGAEDELTQAVEGKAAFSTDEKALNETVATIFTQEQLAELVGPIGEEDDDDDDDDEEEED